MRGFLVAVVAALFGVVAAWGMTRREFPRPEEPLPQLQLTSAAAQDDPQVVVEGSDTFEFGAMEVFGTRSHTFQLRNDGGAPLTLKKGATTCKCTISELEEGAIAPGESREVTLEWTPKAATDQFEQTAEILTNDPRRPTVRLRVVGRVRDSLRIEPREVALGQLPSTEATSFDIKVWSYQPEPWRMTGSEFLQEKTAQYFRVEARDMTAEELASQEDAKNGQVLRVVVEPGLPLGNINQTLRIKQEKEGRSPLDIHITGKAVGDITAFGAAYNSDREYLDLGNVRSGQGAKAKIFIAVKGTHRGDTKLSIQEVDPAATLKVTLGEPTSFSGKTVLWPLTVEIPPGAEPVNRLGSETDKVAHVNIATTHPDIPVFTVRLRFAVTREE
jgi:hypothetical protein